jgi:vacuolar-type H+-ATPase subunit H
MSDYNPQDPADPANAPVRWTAGSAPVPSPNVQATMQQMTEQLQTVIDAAERAAEAIRYDAEEQARRHLAEAQRKADRLTAERVGLISELTDDLVRHAANVRDHSEQMVRALEDAINSVTDKLEQPAMTDPFPGAEPPGPSLPFTEPLYASGPPPPPETPLGGGTYTDLVGAPHPPPAVPPSPPPAVPAPPREPVPPAVEYTPVEPRPPVEMPPAQPPEPSRAPDPTPAEAVEESPEDQPQIAVEAEPAPPQPVDRQPTTRAEPEVPQDALLHATRLAVAGEGRDAIANALRDQFGIEDPDPVVDRVLGGA